MAISHFEELEAAIVMIHRMPIRWQQHQCWRHVTGLVIEQIHSLPELTLKVSQGLELDGRPTGL